MADINIKRMSTDLGRIEAEIERLQRKAQSFREVIAHYEEHGEEDQPKTAPSAAFHDAMEHILSDEGKPLHYKTGIYARLIQRGVYVPGENPARNVGSHLSLDKRFANFGRGMWGLAIWKQSNDTPQKEVQPTPIRPAVGLS